MWNRRGEIGGGDAIAQGRRGRAEEALLRGKLDSVARALHAEWASKREIATGISTGRIEEALGVAIDAGATTGKVSGAGGGGIMMFLTPLERRHAVIRALVAHGFTAGIVGFTSEGALAWRM